MGALCCMIALLLTSLVMWLMQLPVETAETFGQLAFGVGCLVSGIFAGKFIRRAGIFSGIKAALLLFLPVATIMVISGGGDGSSLFGRMIIAVICGAVGGVIGVNNASYI